VIDGSHKLSPLISGVALDRRPQPVEQGPSIRDEAPKSRIRRPATEIETAKALLAKDNRLQGGDNSKEAAASTLHSRRALDAYSSNQHNDDREYVSKVLGVDEYA